ncbi:hypothetical protein CHU98_g8880, partial [Xylaria longipes]
MTSTPSQEGAEAPTSLGDIRQTYAGKIDLQNYSLRHLHPFDFSARKPSGVVPGWEDKSFGKEETHALDVAIIVLRHLFSFIADEHRQEDKNPFAKMIWADLGFR